MNASLIPHRQEPHATTALPAVLKPLDPQPGRRCLEPRGKNVDQLCILGLLPVQYVLCRKGEYWIIVRCMPQL